MTTDYYPAGESFSTRNIIIVGKTGAGKATIANAIMGEELFTVGNPIQSSTRQADDSVTVRQHRSQDGYTYKIALIDTVGVKDDRRLDQKIRRRVDEALSNFSYINLVIFVYKLERFTPQERESFKELMPCFESRIPNASAVTALVVTCCEQKEDQSREEIKREIARSNTATAEVAQFARKGTLLVGLPKLNQVPSVIRAHVEQTVKKDQKQLQDLAVNARQEEHFSQVRTQVRSNSWWSICSIV